MKYTLLPSDCQDFFSSFAIFQVRSAPLVRGGAGDLSTDRACSKIPCLPSLDFILRKPEKLIQKFTHQHFRTVGTSTDPSKPGAGNVLTEVKNGEYIAIV